MSVGNVSLSRKGNVITLRLLVKDVDGPVALFTSDSIGTLIGVLKMFQAQDKPPPTVTLAEDDWSDLV